MSRRQWKSLEEIVRVVDEDDIEGFIKLISQIRHPNENLPLVGYTFTPLLYACRMGKEKHVEHLLTLEDVNKSASDNYGFSALHNAIHSGNTKLFRKLTRSVLPSYDRQGNSCLHHGAMCGSVEVVKLCLNNLKLSAEEKNIEGQTPLHLAANAAVADLLIKAGAQVNEPDNCGWTPLHHAAYNGTAELVAFLIRNSADLTALANEGQRPQDLAADFAANSEALEVFRRYALRRSSTEQIMSLKTDTEELSVKVEEVKVTVVEVKEVQVKESDSIFEEVESVGSSVQASSIFEEVESINSASSLSLSRSEIVQSPAGSLAKLTHSTSDPSPSMSPHMKSVLSELLLKTTSNIDFTQLKFYGVETIKFSELKIREEIGRGAYGKVCRAYFRDNRVAVKVSHIENVTQRVVMEFMKEIQNLIQIRHPRFLLLLAICVEGPLCIVTELAKGGNLADALKEQRIQEQDKLRIAMQIAEGMNYIHNKDPPIVHRDLKPQNILLDTFMQVKVADLGLSRSMGGNSANTMRLEDTELFAGTIRYMAPELFDEEPSCSRATDVWSFGCILHQLFTNELPWHNLELSAVQRRLVLKQPFPIREDLPEDWKALVRRCTDLDPRSRPRFNQIMSSLEELAGVPQSLPM